MQPQQSRGGKPQDLGIIYAMSRAKASVSSNLIVGSCLIYDRSLSMLFDSQVTHFFVSNYCLQELSLSVRELQYDLVVSTPASS